MTLKNTFNKVHLIVLLLNIKYILFLALRANLKHGKTETKTFSCDLYNRASAHQTAPLWRTTQENQNRELSLPSEAFLPPRFWMGEYF